MQRYENYYFKQLHGEQALMSGLPLPDQDQGPYEFVDCNFHPRVWEALQQMYHTSTFTKCNWTPGIR